MPRQPVFGKLKIEEINAIAELDRAGVAYSYASDDEVKLCCVSHNDSNPSAQLNLTSKLWHCHGCGASGNFIGYLSLHLGVKYETVVADLSGRYAGLKTRKTIRPDIIEKYHEKIWDATEALQALYARGVSDNLIRSARLGFDKGRITIPVYDGNRRCINIRKYKPGAPGPEKMLNTVGYATKVIYQQDQLEKYETIWVTGGEMKALVAGHFLTQGDIGAIAVTAGEGAWDATFNTAVTAKHIYICMDIDKAGVRATNRIANEVFQFAASVWIVTLPLDPKEHPKGDINDWVVSANIGLKDFLALMESARKFIPESILVEESLETVQCRLVDAVKAENTGRRFESEALLCMSDMTPFFIAREVDVACEKNQNGCSHCLVFIQDQDDVTGKARMTVKPTSRFILAMVDAKEAGQEKAIREAIGMAPCKTATITVKSNHSVVDCRLSPPMKFTGDNTQHIVQAAYIVGDRRLDLNVPYQVGGRVYPHPENQQATLLIDEVKIGEDSLANYEPSAKDLERLKIFRPKTWTMEGLDEFLDSYYSDLAANVTRIYKRRNLHFAADLTWMSCLYFRFDGRRQNGWVNSLILGDSSQGKSETVLRLMAHYQTGVRHDCKNATVAGLLGGVQQTGKRWFVTWGCIPTHDRSLVALEELKGAPVEVVAALTDMRSSGIAELVKIERRVAHARTRLICISNSRSGRTVSSFNFGVEAIRELIGSPEDIRRFDFATLVANEHVDPREINQLSIDKPQYPHKFTSQLCKMSVLFAWTRSVDQILLTDSATTACLQHATELVAKYSEALPLVDRGTMRFKLARLAIALAARTNSVTPDDAETILVRKVHVDYIAKFLDDEYSDPIFGYAEYSHGEVFKAALLDETVIRAALLASHYPKDLVEHLIHTDEITLNDLCDWCETTNEVAQQLVSLLVRKHAMVRRRTWYTKNAKFIALLKTMVVEGLPEGSQDDKEAF